MSFRASKITIATALLLQVIGTHFLSGQQTLPDPGKDASALIEVLASDGPTFEKAKACQQLAIVGDASSVPALALLLNDAQLATYARSALENIPGDQSDQALRAACDSLEGNNLLGVIHSLGKREHADAIPVLAKLLDAEDQSACVAAARAIGQIGTEKAASVLGRAVSDSTGERQVELAKACLICAQQLIKQGDTTSLESMFQNLSDADLPRKIKLAAAYQEILSQGASDTTYLFQMFKSGEPDQFEMAMHAARRLDRKAEMSIEFAVMLELMEKENKIQLLALFADQGDRQFLPAILKLATSEDVDVRVASLQAMSTLGDSSCVPVLLEACTSKEKPIVDAAISAAVSIESDRLENEVIKMLGSKDAQTVLPAIEIAAGRRMDSATELLHRLRNSPDKNIRKRAVYALGQVATVDQFDSLVAMMIEMNGDELFPDIQQALKSACLRMPQDRCAQILATAMDGAPGNSQTALMEQLAFVGGPRALSAVVSAAKSNDDAMQDAATRVLGEWLTADAAPEIFELAKSYPKGKYRTRILRGYIRIARQLSMTMEERMEVCRNALDIADRKEEKLLVLDVLRRHRSHEGLAIAESLVNEPGLTGKAKTVIQKIKEDIGDDPDVGFVPLFDGKTLGGWKGGDLSFWRVEDGAIVGGDLVNKVKQNEFLRTTKEYGDFELRLQFKLTGEKTNAGVQIRTAEIPDHHEVSGYQADLGDGWWGCLYDESRRRKMLAGPPANERAKPVRMGQWNDYRILCEGKRIQLWINGTKTVDYTEKDPDIPQTGIIALQVHGNLIMEARYRNIRIKELR